MFLVFVTILNTLLVDKNESNKTHVVTYSGFVGIKYIGDEIPAP